MDGIYEITMGGKPVGKASVRREGLYWRFSCRCDLTGAVVCRLAVSCGGREENLGVLVPMEGKFGIEKRIPVKRLGEDAMRFRIVPKHEETEGKFVPIYPEEPFAYMTRLKDAFLARKDGQPGIVIREEKSGCCRSFQISSSSPTGQ